MFDHAQSPRLGQPTAVENPGVQLCTLETLPEAAYRGQIVYRLDDDHFQVYDGVAWQNPAGGGVGTGGTQTFISALQPVADAIGDQWMCTTDYQLYVWDGSNWQHVTNERTKSEEVALINLAFVIQQITPPGATGVVRLTFDITLPLSPAQYDCYVDKATNKAYQYNGAAWIEQTGTVGVALNAVGYERFIPDGTIDVYFDTVAPLGLGPYDIGDLWIVENLNNLVRYWTGGQWMDLQITQGYLANGSVGYGQIQDEAVDGSKHVIDHSIVTINLADNIITGDKIDDFAVAVTHMVSRQHLIY